MMKGADGAMLHVLAALHVPCTLVRVWQHVSGSIPECWPCRRPPLPTCPVVCFGEALGTAWPACLS